MATQTTPPAGWYADPVHRHDYRYWDGNGWTDHVADADVASADALVPPAVPVAPSTPRAAESSPQAAESSPEAAESSPEAAESSPEAAESSPEAAESSRKSWYGRHSEKRAAKAMARQAVALSAACQEAGVIGPDDEVEACASLQKSATRSGPGVWVQQFSTIVVTKRQVIITQWQRAGGKVSADTMRNALLLERPQDLSLTKSSWSSGLSVPLTTAIADFLRQDVAYPAFLPEQVAMALNAARTTPSARAS